MDIIAAYYLLQLTFYLKMNSDMSHGSFRIFQGLAAPEISATHLSHITSSYKGRQ